MDNLKKEINKIKSETKRITESTNDLVREMRKIDEQIAKKKIMRIYVNRLLGENS